MALVRTVCSFCGFRRVLVVKGLEIQEKVKCSTFLASFMIQQSLLQCGMAVQDYPPLPWTHDSHFDGPFSLVTLGGYVW